MRDALSLLNPWWTDPSAWGTAPSPLQRRPLRSVAAQAAAAEDPRAALLIGPRRIGKTTLVKQLLREFASGQRPIPPQNLCYADFQERMLGGVSPEDVVAALAKGADERFPLIVALDEIQFVADWDKALRGVVHRWVGPRLRIVATGSGAGELRRGAGDTLLDRVALFRLGPMTFPEFETLNGGGPDRPPAEAARLFGEYLRRGGFPGMSFVPEAHEVARRLREFCETYVLDGDVVRRQGIRQSDALARLWLHLVRRPGELLNATQLANEAGAKRDTVDGWLAALQQAELLVAVPPSDRAGRPTFGKQRYPKGYPVDHALCAAYGAAPDEGPALETLVLRHLAAYAQRSAAERAEHVDLSYWNEKSVEGPNEADFRLVAGARSALIEVKGTTEPGRYARRAARVAGLLKKRRAHLVHVGDVREDVRHDGVRVTLWPVVDFARALEPADAPEAIFGDE